MSKKYLLIVCTLIFGCSAPFEQKVNPKQQIKIFQKLSDDFIDPPMSSRPGAFWAWLNGDVTKESITNDLEEMKDKGMARAEIWDVEARNNTDGVFGIGPKFLGDGSVELIKHALSEGKRLEIRIGMIASSGGNAGGSWVTPDWAAKALYSSELKISGSKSFSGPLPFPELPNNCPKEENGMPIFFKEIAVLAIPDHPEKKIKDLTEVVILNQHFDGKIPKWEVPDGMNYNLLVLPNIKYIPDDVVKKVETMIAAGANVLIQNPEVARSINGDILQNMTVDDALTKLSIAKDFTPDEHKLDFIHRKIGDVDMYFVTNKTDHPIRETCEFRMTNKCVEFWDPVTAQQFNIANTKSTNDKTAINLRLPLTDHAL